MIVDTEVQCVDDVLDDLTEREGDDREVVALQTKNRDTDEEAENGSGSGTDHNRDDEAKKRWHRTALHQHRPGRGGEGTDAHEAGVSEGQLTGDTDHEVQTHRHDAVDRERNEKSLDEGAHLSGIQENLDDDVREKHHTVGDHIRAEGLHLRCRH